jgi:hypothetical protein
MRISSLFASTAVLAITVGTALTSAGCPSSDDKKCSDYVPPATFDPNTPVVSFRNDVAPKVFNFSCTFTSCHGTQSGSSNGIYLGGNGSDPAQVRAGIVDQPAPELPSMAFVKPGDPRNSYLMRKMDGSQCVLNAQCKDGDCLDSMPHNEDTLDEDTRNIVRRWIAQGAQDN